MVAISVLFVRCQLCQTHCFCCFHCTGPDPYNTSDMDMMILTFRDFTYLFIFREGEGREKEREININVWLPLMHPLLDLWPTTQACALTGN